MKTIIFILLVFSSTTLFSKVHFDPIKNYTSQEKSVLLISEKLSNSLLNSQCFSNFMVNRGLIETNGETPLVVINNLRTKELTVPVEMYSAWWSKVVGYRQPPSLKIYTNRKFHAGSTACSRASNLTHEWSHSVGYGHSFENSPVRPYSIPYSINAAFSVCCFCSKNSITECSTLP